MLKMDFPISEIATIFGVSEAEVKALKNDKN